VSAFQQARGRARVVQSVGWHGGAYLLPSGETFGTSPEPLVFLGSPGSGGDDPDTAGTLEAWRDQVAAPLEGNPLLAFMVACAFAGPLLRLSGIGGGGFHLRAFSSKGKSTGLECAASVWSCPNPLPTWRATANGLEGIAHAHDAGFLPLDELSQVDAREAGQAAYLLANGAGKARANKDGDARASKRWELIFLSTGEVSLAERMSEDGQRQRAGQEVRLVDIPCPSEGLIREWSGHASPGALADQLRAAARANYGHPIRAFLRELTGLGPDALGDGLRDMQERWRTSVLPPGADGQVRRAAGRFALVATAGELAQRFGVLPWAASYASEAARVAFRAWLEARGGAGASEEMRGIQAVLDFLERHGLSRFDHWDGGADSRVINRAGTRKKADPPAEGWDYYLTPEGWKEACSGFDSRALARLLVKRGLLDTDKAGKAQLKVRVPGHGECRLYVLRAASVARYLEAEDAA
jgi:putative DNA primase/helicase